MATKGYLIPEVINPQDEVCYSVPVPNDKAYIEAFFGQLSDLSYWGMWDKTPQKQGTEAAKRWRESYARIAECSTGVTIKDEDCSFINPTSVAIEYAPNDPYQTPDLTPDGYLLPPWRIMGGLPHTDLLSIPTNILQLPDLILNSGLPRFKVRFRGAGHVQLYLRDIPQGGYAFITLDGNPIGIFSEMAGISAFDFGSWLQLILALIGASLDGNLTNQHIVEVPVETGGQHYIDVTALPNITASSLLGFGFQVERVKICTDEPQVLEEPMPQFQLNGCNLEWRPNPQASWASLGNVCGNDGVDGQNAPTPVFSWLGTVLRIDANADGIIDLEQDLKGDTGAAGADGVCLDLCEGNLDTPINIDWYCRAAHVVAREVYRQATAEIARIRNSLTPTGFYSAGIEYMIPMSERETVYYVEGQGDFGGVNSGAFDTWDDVVQNGTYELILLDYLYRRFECLFKNELHSTDDYIYDPIEQHGSLASAFQQAYEDVLLIPPSLGSPVGNSTLSFANGLFYWFRPYAYNQFSTFIKAINYEANLSPIWGAHSCVELDCGQQPVAGCWEWDFLTSDHDFDTINQLGYGHWVNGTGWVENNVSGNTRVDIVSPVFANAVRVTRVEVDSDYEAGTSNPNQYIALNSGGYVAILDDNTPTEGVGITVGVDCDESNVSYLRVSWNCGDNSSGGATTVKAIRVYYDAVDNPFPSLPC